MSVLWDPAQLGSIDNIRNGAGNTAITSRAGGGKTSVIVEAAKELYRSCFLLAFNTRIANELKRRINFVTGAQALTVNSMGNRVLQRVFKGLVEVDGRHEWEVARTIVAKSAVARADRKDQQQIVGELVALVSYAKNTLLHGSFEDLLLASQRSGHGTSVIDTTTFIELALEMITYAKEHPTRISFNDQVWLPLVLGHDPPTASTVLVDEYQDLNPMQIAFIRKTIAFRGRLIVVGDDRQSIYGWRGAAGNVLAEASDVTTRLLLPVSYRLPLSGVALVQLLVPDIQAAPGAIEGRVEWVTPETLESAPEPGDFVLSRTNAPLLRLCLRYLRDGKRAVVAGKDLAKGLKNLCLVSKTHTTADLIAWSKDHEIDEEKRLLELDNPPLIENLRDRMATLRVLCDGLQTVAEVTRRIEHLFQPEDEVGDDRSQIVCATTHKAKGLERPRVFLVHATFFKPADKANAEERAGPIGYDHDGDAWLPISGLEEQNVYYVAISRHQQELWCCGGPQPGFVAGAHTPPRVPNVVLTPSRVLSLVPPPPPVPAPTTAESFLKSVRAGAVVEVPLPPPPPRSPFAGIYEQERRARPPIPEELQAAMDEAPDADFVISCAECFERTGRLSEKQLVALARWGKMGSYR